MKTGARFFLHYGDMTDATNLIRIVQEVQPDEIYNLAAQSHVQVSFETPEYTANADALGTLRLLEAIRILGMADEDALLSGLDLGALRQGAGRCRRTKTTPFYPRSPYARGQALCLLDHRELPRGLRHARLQRHPVQSREPDPRRDLRHPQDHPGGGGRSHLGPAGRALSRQSRRRARLGPRARLCRRHVADPAAGRARRLRARDRRDAYGAGIRRARLRATSAATIEWQRRAGSTRSAPMRATGEMLVAGRSALFPADRGRSGCSATRQGARNARLAAQDHLPRAGHRDGAKPTWQGSRASAGRICSSMPRSDLFDLARPARLGRGPSRHGRLRIWCGGSRPRAARSSSRRARRSICAARTRPRHWMRGGAARRGVRRGGQGRRHPRQRHPAGRVHLRQPGDRERTSSTRAIGPAWRSWCSSARPASTRAYAPQPMHRGVAADRAARADQPVVRHRQDRRASRCARPTAASTAATSSPPCRPTSTGRDDNFDLAGSHVVPALMRKAHEARLAGSESLSVWGSGQPRREFLYVDDCADAVVHLCQALFGRAARQRRHRRGRLHRRARGTGLPGRRLRGPARFRSQQAGRHAAQAARRVAPACARAGTTQPRSKTVCGVPMRGFSRRTRGRSCAVARPRTSGRYRQRFRNCRPPWESTACAVNEPRGRQGQGLKLRAGCRSRCRKTPSV